MWKLFLNLFRPPVFAKNDEKTRVARTLHQILIISFCLPVLALIAVLLSPENLVFLPMSAVFEAGVLGLMAANRSGRVRLAGIVYILFLIVVFAYADTLIGGLARPEFILLTSMVILISGLLLGGNAPIFTSIALVIIRIIMSTLGNMGLIVKAIPPSSIAQEILTIGIGYVLIAILFRQATTGTQSAVEKLRQSQSALEATNLEL